MKLRTLVLLTIAAFAFFGIVFGLCVMASGEVLPPETKACQAKYSATVEQLVTAAAAMDVVTEPDRRQVVINLAAQVQHSYDLLAADPAHSSALICDPQRLAELDSVTRFLRQAGYLPDQGERATLQARVSVHDLGDGIARFWTLFPPGTVSPDFPAETQTGQKRATGPRTNSGVLPPR